MEPGGRAHVRSTLTGDESLSVSNDPPNVVHARLAGLVYVSDDMPGIRRRRSGRGFSYYDPAGRTIRDRAELARIRSLAVPPAYSSVWICPHTHGHIQATGRDERGRKQYRYHPDWRTIRDVDKFDRMLDFARRLPGIRRQLDDDLQARDLSQRKVLATVVSLLDRTLIRVGNAEYARSNESYGLTTLKDGHLDVVGTELRFAFKGKSGKRWQLNLRDRRIAGLVRKIQDLPGQTLFQYVGMDGKISAIESADVNAYLREIAGEDVSSKDFRTWAGTVQAAWELARSGPFSSEKEARSKVRFAVERVSQRLGNTVTVCRKCYIHPDIIASYLEQDLPSLEAIAPTCTSNGASPLPPLLETKVLEHLDRRLERRGG